MNKQDQIKEYYSQLEKATSDTKKAAAIIGLVTLLNRQDSSDVPRLLKEGFALKNIELEQLFSLFECKLIYYNSIGEVTASITTAEAYDKAIPEDLKHFASRLYCNTFKMINHTYLGEIPQALAIANKNIPIAESLQDQKVEVKLADTYRIAAQLELRVGNTEQAIVYLHKALKLKEKLKDRESIFTIYRSFGSIYEHTKDYEKAKEYLHKAIECNREFNHEHPLSVSLYALAAVLEANNELEAASHAYAESLEMVTRLNNKGFINRILPNLFLNYAKLRKEDKFYALEKRILKEELYKTNKDIEANFYHKACEAHLILGNNQKALDYSNLLEEVWEEMGDLRNLIILYKLKIEILQNNDAYKKANAYYKKLIDTKEKILNEANQKALKEFEVKFENEKKEKEIQALKLESVSFQLQSLRAQMNPHFVFNTIASISQDLHPETIQKSQTLLESFARLMRANLDFAEEEKITLDDEIKFLKDYLLLEQNRLGDKLSFSIDFDPDMDLDFIEIPSMLLQPYIENAVKHGIMPLEGPGEIKVLFEELGDKIVCTIHDNGIGREAAEIRKKKSAAHAGKATSINAKRLELLSPKIKNSLKVVYQDKVDENNRPAGTKVQVFI